MEPEGFDDLIRSAKTGDPEAVRRLLVSIRPYVAKVASGYVDSRASGSVSDLVQEAELRAWQRLEQFEGGPGDEESHAKFRTWVVQIVRHIAIDRNRASHTQRRRAEAGRPQSLDAASEADADGSKVGKLPREPAASTPTPSGGLEISERCDLVRLALEQVRDPIDREVIRLYFFEQMSLPAIARQLDWTYDRVRERYRRGIRELESYLQVLKPK